MTIFNTEKSVEGLADIASRLYGNGPDPENEMDDSGRGSFQYVLEAVMGAANITPDVLQPYARKVIHQEIKAGNLETALEINKLFPYQSGAAPTVDGSVSN